MKNRIILHIDMDYFFAQIEERENPRFQGRPVVVGAEPRGGKGRGVVSTCNYEARKYGIKSGMPISEAWSRCSEAIFLPVNMELYQKVSEKIFEIVKKYSKIGEIVSLDEAYLDLSFLTPEITVNKTCPPFQRSLKWGTRMNLKNLDQRYKMAKISAKKLKKEIFEKEKLTSTIGIGPNKMIAKMACARAKPNGLLVIKPEQIKSSLEPSDIEDLPGIGPKTSMRITQSLSFRSRHYAKAPIRIRDLKKLSKKELIKTFGKVGETIYERARGVDETPVTSEEVIKSIGKEHTFGEDTRDPEIIFKKFEEIITNIHKELLRNNFSFRTITVVCRFSGFETHTKAKTLNKPIRDLEILKKEAKILLLRFLVRSKKPVRLIGLRVKIC